MRTHVRTARIHRRTRTAHAVVRPTVSRLPVIVRSALPARRQRPVLPAPSSPLPGFKSDPYVDYGAYLTSAGGILLSYKDLDLRLRQTLWRLLAWSVSTGIEGWFLFNLSPIASPWINGLCLLTCAVINWLIVSRPVEVQRTIEIRPDCMILDGADLFWRQNMEGGWPRLKPDGKGNLVLSGIYGTRWIEYLTVRRFDELDRMPEVFASNLQGAMKQLWPPALHGF